MEDRVPDALLARRARQAPVAVTIPEAVAMVVQILEDEYPDPHERADALDALARQMTEAASNLASRMLPEDHAYAAESGEDPGPRRPGAAPAEQDDT